MKSLFLSKKVLIWLIGICLLLGGGFTVYKQKNKSVSESFDTKKVPSVEVMRVNDFQSGNSFISAIGVVESQDQVELKSEISSTVKKVYVNLGDTVKKGQLLVELNHDTLDAQLNQAASGINRAQGNLDQQLAGATDENIDKAQASIDQAHASLDQAKAQLQNTKIASKNKIENAKLTLEQARTDLLNSDSTADQTLDNMYDNALNVARTALSQIKASLITITDIQYKYFSCFDSTICSNIANAKTNVILTVYGDQDGGRYNLETVSNLKGILPTLFDKDTLSKQEMKDNLPRIIIALKDLKKLIESVQVGLGTTFAANATDIERNAIANLKNVVDTQMTAITNADNSIQDSALNKQTLKDAKQSLYDKALENYNAILKQAEEDEKVAQSMVDSAQASLLQAQAVYGSVTASPRDVDLKSFQASIQESQASYQLIKANRDKAFIEAPFDGVISVLPVKRGELVSPGSRIISIVNDGGLQVSAYINERDRALIEEGTESFVEDTIKASVVHIAPSVDPQTRKVRVISVLEDTDQENNLLIDQYVRIKFTATDKNTASTFLLPLAAIKTTTRGSFVFTTESVDGKVVIKELPIQVGRIIGENIEVVEGISSEIELITNVRGLKNGQEVTVD